MPHKKNKVAFVLRSVGLEYDDRIRKECISAATKAEIKIFVLLYNNKAMSGVTSYGVEYQSFSLLSRKFLPIGKYLFIKALEFYLRVRKYLNSYNIIWAHEEYAFMFALCSKRNKTIWDLHEIPAIFHKKYLRILFNYIEKKSKVIIHANYARIRYNIKAGLIKHPQVHTYINNFPDREFTESKLRPECYDKFTNFMNGSQYVYLQGVNVADRYPYNSIAAVLLATNFKVVVAGRFDDCDSYNSLLKKFGVRFKNRVLFVGMVNQLTIPALLSNSQFTIVLYDAKNPNNRYCEANRFYQSISLGVPVITGCNESMAEHVNRYNIGISMDSDGKYIIDLISAIKDLMHKYEYYKNNAYRNRDTFLWNMDKATGKWLL